MFKKNDALMRKTAVGLLAVTMLATACSVTATESAPTLTRAQAPQLVQADSSFDRDARTAFSRQAVSFATQDEADPDKEEYDESEDDMFFEGVDWFTLAAERLGMDEDALWTAIEEGKTIAELAQEANVDVQAIVDAIKTAETELLNQLVADGVITQAEADEWLAEMDEEIRQFVEESFTDMFIGVDWFTLAAEALGMDEEALWQAIENGQSVGDIAAEQGVETQTIIDAIIAAETEAINQAVADGKLTQEEADEWLQYLAEDARAFVEDSWDECEDDFYAEDFLGVDWFAETAKLLNMDEDTMWQALEGGQTISQLATDAGIDPQTIIDTLVAAETEAINKAVADGKLTQEEADEWLQFLAEDAAEFVNESWSFEEFEDDFFDGFEDGFEDEPESESDSGNA